MIVHAEKLRNGVMGDKFGINKANCMSWRKWQFHSFLQERTKCFYMTWSRWSSVTFVLLRDVQPPADTFWYHQESVTIKSERVTRILIKILGNRVEHAKKAVSLTFLMTWGKTKTWTTDSKNNSEESGFECEFLQVLKSIYFDCMHFPYMHSYIW